MTAETSNQAVPLPRGTGVVFVTGAGGFIGRHVASAFRGAGWRVAGFGRSAAPNDPALGLAAPDAWFAGPIDRAALSRAAAEMGRPEVVVHAAGGATVGASLADPAGDFARNVESTREMLAFLQDDAREARLVFLSSAAVYGAVDKAQIGESAALAPLSPYGEHKRQAEELIEAAADAWGLDAAIGRFFSVYGPGNRKQLLWEVASALAAGQQRLTFSGSGEEQRDFLYIDDAVQMIGLLSGLDRAAIPRVVNCGGGVATTVRQAVEGLCRAFGVDAEIVFSGVERPGDPRRLVSCPQLARQIGFSPAVALDEGLARTARWVGLTNPPQR